MSVYVLIRVPKCGSSSLRKMFSKALPNSSSYYISNANHELLNESNPSIIEGLRVKKNHFKSLWKRHRVLSSKSLWKKTNQNLKDDDIIHGHLTFDSLKLKNTEGKIISIIRNPYDRLLSDYNYSRNSYFKKNYLSKNIRNKLYFAGNYSFEGYISYLQEQKPISGRIISRFIIGKGKINNPIEFIKQNYFSIGLLEKMDLFIDDFYMKTGLILPKRNENVTLNREIKEISQSQKNAISKFCDEDIFLYNQIKNYLECK